MKHLRKFNESVNDLKEDLTDICQELVDEGYGIFFNQNNLIIGKSTDHPFLWNEHTKLLKFHYGDVSEVVERIKDYLGERVTRIRLGEYGTWVDVFSPTHRQSRLRSKYPVTNQHICDVVKISTSVDLVGKVSESIRSFRKSLNTHEISMLDDYEKQMKKKALDRANDIEERHNTIKDILLYLEDEGFVISVFGSTGLSENIKISRYSNFKYSDIEETVVRLEDYLGDGLAHVEYWDGVSWYSRTNAMEVVKKLPHWDISKAIITYKI